MTQHIHCWDISQMEKEELRSRPSDPWRWAGPEGRWWSDPPSWCRWKLCRVWRRRWRRSPSVVYCLPDRTKLSANCPRTVSADTTGCVSPSVCVCVHEPECVCHTLLTLLSSIVSLEMVCVISGQRMRRMVCRGHTAAFRLVLSAKLSTRSNNFSAASEHTCTEGKHQHWRDKMVIW